MSSALPAVTSTSRLALNTTTIASKSLVYALVDVMTIRFRVVLSACSTVRLRAAVA